MCPEVQKKASGTYNCPYTENTNTKYKRRSPLTYDLEFNTLLEVVEFMQNFITLSAAVHEFRVHKLFSLI